jgi:hypothetical protein
MLVGLSMLCDCMQCVDAVVFVLVRGWRMGWRLCYCCRFLSKHQHLILQFIQEVPGDPSSDAAIS